MYDGKLSPADATREEILPRIDDVMERYELEPGSRSRLARLALLHINDHSFEDGSVTVNWHQFGDDDFRVRELAKVVPGGRVNKVAFIDVDDIGNSELDETKNAMAATVVIADLLEGIEDYLMLVEAGLLAKPDYLIGLTNPRFARFAEKSGFTFLTSFKDFEDEGRDEHLVYIAYKDLRNEVMSYPRDLKERLRARSDLCKIVAVLSSFNLSEDGLVELLELAARWRSDGSFRSNSMVLDPLFDGDFEIQYIPDMMGYGFSSKLERMLNAHTALEQFVVLVEAEVIDKPTLIRGETNLAMAKFAQRAGFVIKSIDDGIVSVEAEYSELGRAVMSQEYRRHKERLLARLAAS